MLRPNTITRILNTLNSIGFLVNFVTGEISLRSHHISEIEIIGVLSDANACAIDFIYTPAGYRIVQA